MTLAGENFGLTTSSSGLGDRYEVDLAAPAMSADLLLTFPQNLPIAEFDVFFAAADETGVVGPLTQLTFDVLQVGTGDVQVTLGWDTVADVDLHVIDPNGDEVYWANRMVPSGGELDLDSNAGCSEGVSNENITWPEGLAPRGTYIVRVDRLHRARQQRRERRGVFWHLRRKRRWRRSWEWGRYHDVRTDHWTGPNLSSWGTSPTVSRADDEIDAGH